MDPKILIGTSGWGYDEWAGTFYPKGLAKDDYLPFYSKIFYTNEINTTFYNIPSQWVVSNWVKKTPKDFLFSAKIPQTITHDCKLDVNKCMEPLEEYLKAMDPLVKAKKLWALLIQLPPSFKKEDHFHNLREFIDNWPRNLEKEGYHLVVEFRHLSWMVEKVFEYLKQESLTYCSVIEPTLPPRMDVTNPEFAYVRFHGYGKNIWFDYEFSETEIKKWSLELARVIPQVERIGIYFNNHFSGYATKNSLMMMQELGISPRSDPECVDVLEVKKEAGTCARGQTSLDKFLK